MLRGREALLNLVMHTNISKDCNNSVPLRSEAGSEAASLVTVSTFFTPTKYIQQSSTRFRLTRLHLSGATWKWQHSATSRMNAVHLDLYLKLPPPLLHEEQPWEHHCCNAHQLSVSTKADGVTLCRRRPCLCLLGKPLCHWKMDWEAFGGVQGATGILCSEIIETVSPSKNSSVHQNAFQTEYCGSAAFPGVGWKHTFWTFGQTKPDILWTQGDTCITMEQTFGWN